jgi:hypothetical protein
MEEFSVVIMKRFRSNWFKKTTFNDLLSNIQKPLGIHHIRIILFSLPVNYLKDLRDFGLDKGGVDPFSPKYRLSSIICDDAVSVAIGDNRNRLIFEIWWNFFYDLFSIKNVADVNSIDSFVSKRNMEEFYNLIFTTCKLPQRS